MELVECLFRGRERVEKFGSGLCLLKLLARIISFVGSFLLWGCETVISFVFVSFDDVDFFLKYFKKFFVHLRYKIFRGFYITNSRFFILLKRLGIFKYSARTSMKYRSNNNIRVY